MKSRRSNTVDRLEEVGDEEGSFFDLWLHGVLKAVAQGIEAQLRRNQSWKRVTRMSG